LAKIIILPNNEGKVMAISKLVLGWKMDGSHPKYWLQTGARLPAHEENLVTVSATNIDHHTAILAMSGSGKSFLLGRIIEEIIIRTKCRCVVFDPNADFRRASEVNHGVWDNVSYVTNGRATPLPHEISGGDFIETWDAKRKKILQFSTDANVAYPYETLKLSLMDITGAFLAADLPSGMRTEVAYAHEFLKEVANYLKPNGDQFHLLNAGERLFRLAQKISENDFTTLARNELNQIPQDKLGFIFNTPKYISESGERTYFGSIRRLLDLGLIQDASHQDLLRSQATVLDVIDLPSLPSHEDQLLASHAILNSEWRRARQEWENMLRNPGQKDTRVPTFLVIDEAHNLAPKKPLTPTAEILLDQVRTIVAEGRKFGLRVILVSQRPDKLDPLVLSECENVALMRLSNPTTLTEAATLLNLNIDDQIRQEILNFPKGRARIFGRWTSESRGESLYCAARRTLQGGSDLQSEHWANV
jgi:hypothetical protein